MNISNAIGNLIDACLDDRRMLEHERQVVGPSRSHVLAALADERFAHIEELRSMLEVKDKREHGGSWIELSRELGRGIRVAFGFKSDGDSIAACRQSCMRTERRFDKALELTLPDALREVVVEQRARLASAHDTLNALQY